jgi:hypothetical protein
VKITHRRNGLDATDSFGVEIRLDGSLSDEQQQKLLEVVSRCPVHKTIERGSEVVTSVVSAGTYWMKRFLCVSICAIWSKPVIGRRAGRYILSQAKLPSHRCDGLRRALFHRSFEMPL